MIQEQEKTRSDKYEITFIVNEDSSAETVEKILAANSLSVEKTNDMGTKQFIYPIGKLTSGRYFAIEFVSSPDDLNKIASELKGEKSIIRYLIIKALRKPIDMPKRPGVEKTAEKVAMKKSAADEVKTAEEKPEAKTEVIKEAPQDETKEAPKEEIEIVEKIKEEKNKKIEKIIEKEKVAEEARAEKTEEKSAAKKAKPIKAEKLSAEELDKKLEELVKE